MATPTPTRQPTAHWALEEDDSGGRVRLSGHWDLLNNTTDQKRLEDELRQLESGQRRAWDLNGIDDFDSAGAVLLWRIWGNQYPAELDCPRICRHWFERLAETPALPRRARPGFIWLLVLLGQRLVAVAQTSGGILLLAGQFLRDLGYCLRHPRHIPWTELSATIYQTGASALPLLAVMGFSIGVVMTLQLGLAVAQFGLTNKLINMLAVGVLRELGPVITAIIVVARSASALTANVGAMHITQEFSALLAFGESPRLRLVLPGALGMLVTLPLLTIWTDIMALAGGMMMGNLRFGVSYELFLARLPDAAAATDFWLGFCKAGLFGLIIAIIASYYGLNTKPDTASLSQQITKAVVTGLTSIILLDAILGALVVQFGII